MNVRLQINVIPCPIIPAFFAKVKQFRVYRSVILQILFEKGKERAFLRGSVWVIKKAQA